MNVQMFDGRKRAKVTQSGNQTILVHGKSGTTEVPIKVDADGAVTVDLGQVTLHQGNPGVKAWPTSDANAKTALDAIAANLVDADDATLHDKLDALLAYYKDAEQNTIHDKLDALLAYYKDAEQNTIHDKLDALLAYYKDAEQNTIHDKLDAMTTLLTTMSATLTSMLGVLQAQGGGT